MKVVILAAGLGSRLGVPVPKSLVPFPNGKCLLDYQLAAFLPFVPAHDIVVVVGFKKELIMEHAPSCTYVYNDRFDHTNTSKSLLRALERLDDDVMWVNGDVFFEKLVVEMLASTDGNACLVSRCETSGEEVGFTTSSGGYVAEISKTVQQPEGEALGLNKVARNALSTFTELLRQVDDSDYFERAMEIGIKKQWFRFRAIEKGHAFVREMDFREDYEAIWRHILTRERSS